MNQTIVEQYPWIKAIVPGGDHQPHFEVADLTEDLLQHSPVALYPPSTDYWRESYHFVWRGNVYLDAVRPSGYDDNGLAIKGQTLGSQLLRWRSQGRCPEFVVFQSLWYVCQTDGQVIRGHRVIVFKVDKGLIDQYAAKARFAGSGSMSYGF